MQFQKKGHSVHLGLILTKKNVVLIKVPYSNSLQYLDAKIGA